MFQTWMEMFLGKIGKYLIDFIASYYYFIIPPVILYGIFLTISSYNLKRMEKSVSRKIIEQARIIIAKDKGINYVDLAGRIKIDWEKIIKGRAYRFGNNIDTDQIYPGRYLELTDAEDLAKHTLEGADPSFVERFTPGGIVVAGTNFGCGSSREHAPWALLDYGFRVIIAPSYADIFFNNCFKNGIVPIVLDAQVVDELFQAVASSEGYQLTVDLEAQTITTPEGESINFDVEEFRKHCLLNGLDDIGLTLQHVDEIKAYEKRRSIEAPWLF